jgi:hypothetical protein
MVFDGWRPTTYFWSAKHINLDDALKSAVKNKKKVQYHALEYFSLHNKSFYSKFLCTLLPKICKFRYYISMAAGALVNINFCADKRAQVAVVIK